MVPILYCTCLMSIFWRFYYHFEVILCINKVEPLLPLSWFPKPCPLQIVTVFLLIFVVVGTRNWHVLVRIRDTNTYAPIWRGWLSSLNGQGRWLCVKSSSYRYVVLMGCGVFFRSCTWRMLNESHHRQSRQKKVNFSYIIYMHKLRKKSFYLKLID